jgi:ribonuclease HII
VLEQCWSATGERFVAEPEHLSEVRRAREHLRARGIELVVAKSSVLCTRRLNTERDQGKNRFISDLHAMEELVLSLRAHAGEELLAVCGKVGGMSDYSRFFGPLSQRLHAVLERRRALSAYRFPGLGELRFVQDADAHDALVMLASLIGKYLRELLMARVARHWQDSWGDRPLPSGYNDPSTARFVAASALARSRRRVPDTCFERAKAEDD